MNARCDTTSVDWWNWGITEAATQAVEVFKAFFWFMLGRLNRRKKPTPPEKVTLNVRGLSCVGKPDEFGLRAEVVSPR